jgi:cell wall-associated NlpC family hydrolase
MLDLNDLIGVPFKDGGRNKKEGFDCYGLAMEVYRRYGIELPDYRISCEDASRINQQVEETVPQWIEIKRDELIVPTMVVMRFNYGMLINHTGVFIGGDRILHTIRRRAVHVISINDDFWARKIAGFYIHPSQAKKGEDQ